VVLAIGADTEPRLGEMAVCVLVERRVRRPRIAYIASPFLVCFSPRQNFGDAGKVTLLSQVVVRAVALFSLHVSRTSDKLRRHVCERVTAEAAAEAVWCLYRVRVPPTPSQLENTRWKSHAVCKMA
jgi:hypothetical protein